MKISIEQAVLLKAVSKVQSVVERRGTIPVLSNLLIEASGDAVSFRASDLDTEVVDKVEATVEREGATTVNAITLHEIVRKLPGGALVDVTDDRTSGRLTVKTGRSVFTLATLPKEDFPIMASSEYVSNFTCLAGVLRRLFDLSKFAVSTEETRYYLNGVYMHVADESDGQMLRCVATDGHKLARIDVAMPDGAEKMPGVIVPRKTVNELTKLLDDDKIEIQVRVSETKMQFVTPEVTLTSKVIDGVFPDYSSVIPANNTRRLEVDASEFAKAVDRVATISSEQSRSIKFQIEKDQLTLSVTAPDAGTAQEELIVAYDEDPFHIGFNAKYLLEIAQQVEHDNAVFLFSDTGDPAIVRGGNDESALYVVMPMRV